MSNAYKTVASTCLWSVDTEITLDSLHTDRIDSTLARFARKTIISHISFPSSFTINSWHTWCTGTTVRAVASIETVRSHNTGKPSVTLREIFKRTVSTKTLTVCSKIRCVYKRYHTYGKSRRSSESSYTGLALRKQKRKKRRTKASMLIFAIAMGFASDH